MDDRLRRAERDAALGDPEMVALWRHRAVQMGDRIRERHFPEEVLSDEEELQQDYDDLWWHRFGVARFKFTSFCRCCVEYNQWSSPLVKAKDMTYRDSRLTKNSKRKTMRTHRDGSQKNYRARSKSRDAKGAQEEGSQAPHERRRKKRYGGKEHRNREWCWNPKTERFKIVWTLNSPDLDE